MQPTFVFDGDCAFCTMCARFIERRIATPARIVAWQHADLSELGLTRDACLDAVQWTAPGQPALAGPDAIGALLRSSSPGWRPFGWLLQLPPVRLLAWPLYRLIARNRHRLPGGTAACALSPGHPSNRA